MAGTPRDVATALTELGVVVHRDDGTEVWARCPGHYARTGKEDRSPSWSCNKETGYSNCFSCGYGGTFLDLVMDLKFKNDAFAAHRWIRRHGVRLLDPDDIPDYRAPIAEVERKPGRQPMSEGRLALFYRPPLAMLEGRDIDPEAAEFYDLLWDAGKQAWVVPIRLFDGRLVGWQLKNERTFRNYPMDVPKGECVFGLDRLQPGQTAIFVEAPLDCGRVRTALLRRRPAALERYCAVSGYGAGVTDVQVRNVLRVTDSVVFALDNDRDGWLHTALLARGEEKRGRFVRRGWSARFQDFRVWNYFDQPYGEPKDPGEQSDEEILASLDYAQSVAALRLAPVRGRRDATPPARAGLVRARRVGSARRRGA